MNPIDNHTDDRLLKELDRLAKRVNSEEGIPMFLACENLAPVTAMEEPKTIAQQEINRKFAEMFRGDVEIVQKFRPDAPLTDIAKIIERLAEQDFALGEGE